MDEPLLTLYPRQTVLVTSRHEGRDNIITLDWAMPVSFAPPLVAISVAPKRFSHDMIKGSKEFVLAIPTPQMQEAVLYCGTHSGKDTDKFKGSGLTKAKASKVKAPLIKEAGANIECRLFSSLEAGDHTIFIGEVLETHKESDSTLVNLGHRNFAGLDRK